MCVCVCKYIYVCVRKYVLTYLFRVVFFFVEGEFIAVFIQVSKIVQLAQEASLTVRFKDTIDVPEITDNDDLTPTL